MRATLTLVEDSLYNLHITHNLILFTLTGRNSYEFTQCAQWHPGTIGKSCGTGEVGVGSEQNSLSNILGTEETFRIVLSKLKESGYTLIS